MAGALLLPFYIFEALAQLELKRTAMLMDSAVLIVIVESGGRRTGFLGKGEKRSGVKTNTIPG